MMLTPPTGLLGAADPFGMLMHPSALLRAGGPFGVADRLLHELEDDMRSISDAVFGGEAAQGALAQRGEEEEGALALPGTERLWAAVDVKETPNEFVLSTDVRCDAHRTSASWR
jgi:hypothetical protein